MRGKKLLVKDVYYVPGLQKHLLSISWIMQHSSRHLDFVFSNDSFIVDRRRTKTTAMRVEEHGLFVSTSKWLQERNKKVSSRFIMLYMLIFIKRGRTSGRLKMKSNEVGWCFLREASPKIWFVEPPRCGGGKLGEQTKLYVNGGKADYSDNICSHAVGESMVR